VIASPSAMSAKKDMDVWAHFGEGGALSVDVVSRSEAEELSVRVAELEDEVRQSPRRDLPRESRRIFRARRDGPRLRARPVDNSEDRPSRSERFRAKEERIVDALRRRSPS
jgi:hypothetical protein